MSKLKTGDIVMKRFWGGKSLWLYGIVCGDEKRVAESHMTDTIYRRYVAVAHEGHDCMDNLESPDLWHKVCRYSDNAAVVYGIHPKVVDWFKRCTGWEENVNKSK